MRRHTVRSGPLGARLAAIAMLLSSVAGCVRAPRVGVALRTSDLRHVGGEVVLGFGGGGELPGDGHHVTVDGALTTGVLAAPGSPFFIGGGGGMSYQRVPGLTGAGLRAGPRVAFASDLRAADLSRFHAGAAVAPMWSFAGHEERFSEGSFGGAPTRNVTAHRVSVELAVGLDWDRLRESPGFALGLGLFYEPFIGTALRARR